MEYEKKYKNALEWARQVMNGKTGFIRNEVEEIFPELAESEDERIRKALIGGLKDCIYSEWHDGVSIKECIAWLEKQGEQKHTDKVNSNLLTVERAKKMSPFMKTGFENEFFAWSEDDENTIERLLRLLDNEQDNYPQLSCDFQEIQEFKDWLKSLKDRVQPQPKQE